jgi:hypothetical protein
MSRYLLSGLLILSVWILSWGCDHRTYYEPNASDRFCTPQPIPIKPGMISKPDFKVSETVAVVNAQSHTDWTLLGAFTHAWWANLKDWTNTAAAVATRELKRRGVAVPEDIHLTERAPRILHLAITDVSLDWGSREIGCTLTLRVVTGDGDILDYTGTNTAVDLHDSCDGAVTKQVTAMFNDARIRDYLAAPTKPKDADCDGVPDPIDECPGTPLGVTVDARGCPLDSDGDGVPDYLDECPDTPRGLKVDSRGCPPDSDGDGVPDDLDKCPGTPKGARVDNEGCWVIDEAFFDFDKRDIKPRFYPIFDEVTEVLTNNPSLKIVIEGHTDNIGTKAYNQKLSKERAEAVKRYLIKKGIKSERLRTAGYGFSMPKASNETAEGRAINRRVKLEPLPLPTRAE